MRLDHLGFRTTNRWDTAKFWINAFGYKVQEEFAPYGDNSVLCVALQPPELIAPSIPFIMPLSCCDKELIDVDTCEDHGKAVHATYHMAPEIFISEGKPGTAVGDWVRDRGGNGGLHHMAYMVEETVDETIEDVMNRWKKNGWGNFVTDATLTCEGIEQVFSNPQPILGNILIEFIKIDERGFCAENVSKLIDSTKDVDERS